MSNKVYIRREEINQKAMAIEAPVPPVWSVEDRTIGSTPVRIYKPSEEEGLPIIILIHGGAWVAGNLDTHDNLARYLCAGVGAKVVSVGYTNAPEGKFPLQLNQCMDALLLEKSSRIAVVGDSAGGNMAAALCLMVRDQQGPKIALQVLINPAPDLRNDRWEAELYLSTLEEANDPYASPICAQNLSNLPPALILLAENDDLRADGEKFAQRLKEAGTPTTVYTQKGIGHLAGHGARASLQARESLDVAVIALKKAFK